MGRGHDVGPGGMDLRVDDERRRVHRAPAFDDLALVVDEEEVGHPDVPEVHGEGVDPEVVGELGVAGGDVSGHAFVEAEPGEQTEGGGQALLAMQALVLDRVEGRREGELHLRHGPSL